MGQQDPVFASAKIIREKNDDRFRTWRCPDFTCRNYVYGFTSLDELEKHHLLHKSLDAEEHFRLTHDLPSADDGNLSPSTTAFVPEEPPKLSPLDIANIISPPYEPGPPSVAASSTAVASDAGTMSPTLSAFSTFGEMMPPQYESERANPVPPPPRLESIGELDLPGEQAHCVGCPALENKVGLRGSRHGIQSLTR